MGEKKPTAFNGLEVVSEEATWRKFKLFLGDLNL